MPKYGVYGVGANGLRYGVMDTDALTWAAGGPLGTYMRGLLLSADNLFLFAQANSGAIGTFAVDAASAVPTFVRTTTVSGFYPTVSVRGKRLLYGVANNTTDTVKCMAYSAAGVLSSPVTVLTTPDIVKIEASLDGQWLYVFTLASSLMTYTSAWRCYAIAADGSLSLTATGNLSAPGAFPSQILPSAVSMGGRFSYIGCNSQCYQYAVDASTGALSPLSPASVTVTSMGTVSGSVGSLAAFVRLPVGGYLLTQSGGVTADSFPSYLVPIGADGRLGTPSVLVNSIGAGSGYITPDERMFLLGGPFPTTELVYSRVGGVVSLVSANQDLIQPGVVVGAVFAETATPAPVSGCTNPAAQNYNPLATVDDGSCVYAPGGGGGTSGGGDGHGHGCYNLITWS